MKIKARANIYQDQNGQIGFRIEDEANKNEVDIIKLKWWIAWHLWHWYKLRSLETQTSLQFK